MGYPCPTLIIPETCELEKSQRHRLEVSEILLSTELLLIVEVVGDLSDVYSDRDVAVAVTDQIVGMGDASEVRVVDAARRRHDRSRIGFEVYGEILERWV